MSRVDEILVLKWASIVLIMISILLILLRLFMRPIFRFDFELLLFYIPSIIALVTYFYLKRNFGFQ